MARPKGVPSNELYQNLGDWNDYLKQEKVDLKGPQP